MKSIRYRAGYKYQLVEEYSVQIAICPEKSIETRWIMLTMSGLLTVMAGYAWDGPSGPTINTPDFMRGSLIHDALYQLMREGYLPLTRREDSDRELYRICEEDGMSNFRAWIVFRAVRAFGESSALPEHDRAILEAP